MISCLCPTYRRPNMVAETIRQFLAQDYAGEKELLILDDAGQLAPHSSGPVHIFSISRRFRSLAEKYNVLAGLARGNMLVVWEDDDGYLPWHLTAHAAALARGQFSKPSSVLSNYPGEYVVEPAAGRFHGSIAFTREGFDAVDGWPVTRRADFDQQLMHRLNARFGIADTCEQFPPSYIFMWRSGHYHGQCYVRGEADEEWYDRIPEIAAGNEPFLNSDAARLIYPEPQHKN